jgi:hypothetical protein
MSFAEQAAEKFLRSALRATRKLGFLLTQSGCGAMKECRTPPKVGRGRCALCALLLDQRESVATKELEATAADLLGVHYDWIMSFLQGWDGDDGCTNGYTRAYVLGKKLWNEFRPLDQEASA